MAIPEPVEDAAAQLPIRALHELLTALNASGLALDTLSMGMSADLEAAVVEGATLVRVGTAIFGVRDESRPSSGTCPGSAGRGLTASASVHSANHSISCSQPSRHSALIAQHHFEQLVESGVEVAGMRLQRGQREARLEVPAVGGNARGQRGRVAFGLVAGQPRCA